MLNYNANNVNFCLFVCFCPHRIANEILVPGPGIEPLQWKHKVLATGLPGKPLSVVLLSPPGMLWIRQCMEVQVSTLGGESVARQHPGWPSSGLSSAFVGTACAAQQAFPSHSCYKVLSS